MIVSVQCGQPSSAPTRRRGSQRAMFTSALPPSHLGYSISGAATTGAGGRFVTPVAGSLMLGSERVDAAIGAAGRVRPGHGVTL
jgi:hypothetical protein